MILRILLLYFMLVSSSAWADSEDLLVNQPSEMVVTYRYEKFNLFPSIAQIVIRDKLEHVVGKAEVDRIQWHRRGEETDLEYFIVKETHLGADGQMIYRGRSKFDAEGRKVEEEAVEGRKQFNLFYWWPVGVLP